MRTNGLAGLSYLQFLRLPAGIYNCAGAGTETPSHQQPTVPKAPAADQDTPDQEGGRQPEGNHSSTRRPRPRANATEPQEPEPPPKNEREGRTPAGQTGAEGRATSKPREPAATDNTQREDRRAKADRPEPNRPEATENTNSEEEPAKKDRQSKSTPRAQPTETRTPAGTRGSNEERAAEAPGDGKREPEKPTETKPTNTEDEARTDTAQPTRHNYNYNTKKQTKTTPNPGRERNTTKN